MNRLVAPLLALSLPLLFSACKEKPGAAITAAASSAPSGEPPKEVTIPAAPTPAPEVAAPSAPTEPTKAPEAPSPYAVTDPLSGLGDFGSSEPIERPDLPERGIMSFPVEQRGGVFAPMEHWEQYNFPFKSKRWGRYKVRITYTLKSSTLGVQYKFGETRLKKQLLNTSGASRQTYLGEIYIPQGGEQFMAFYTPNGVGWATFILHEISLVPAPEGEMVKAAGDGTVQLLARQATTWSENMRYEPKPEKDCLGYWTEKDDFAEWEFQVDKPGTYQVTIHHGCGAGGGSDVAVVLGQQELKFTVQDTGGFQKWVSLTAGKLEIQAPGTYRLAVKPRSKNGGAIMDVQKIVLAPVS